MIAIGHATIPTPVLKLHWPDRWCTDCMGETRTLPLDLYECVSCGKVTTGKTEYVQGEVVWVNPTTRT